MSGTMEVGVESPYLEKLHLRTWRTNDGAATTIMKPLQLGRANETMALTRKQGPSYGRAPR